MTLFEEVVRASQLAPILASRSVARALRKAGVVDPEKLTRVQLVTALPQLETLLRVYMTEKNALQRLEDIERLAGNQVKPFRLDEPSLDE